MCQEKRQQQKQEQIKLYTYMSGDITSCYDLISLEECEKHQRVQLCS